MQNLERRIEALENASPANLGRVMVITFPTPGQPDEELYKLHGAVGESAGQQWTREPGESEHDFIDRAKREVKRSEYGVALLFKAN